MAYQPAYRQSLPPLTRVTMGTGGITDPANRDQLTVTRMAMDAGVWFHCADYGGGVYAVLKRAFSEDPAHIPHCICKVDGTSAEGFRDSLRDTLDRVGIERIDIGQVCGNPVGEEMLPLLEAMLEARQAGLVSNYIMDVIPAYTDKVVHALRDELFDGYIFYLNVMERGMGDRAYDQLVFRGMSAFAMRTFGGRDGANFLKDEAHPRRQALWPVYERSGCATPLEFTVRYPLSLPHVVTTIGSTSNPERLQAFLEAGNSFKPLAPEVVETIEIMHRKWNAGL